MWLSMKNLLFSVLVPGTVAGYVPWYLVRDTTPGGAPWRIAGACAWIFGLGIYLWCLWDFATFGRGTPAPIDPPSKLVIRGLYRHTRNPMYVGVVSAILGWALAFRSIAVLIYAAAMAGVFHAVVLVYEEPTLRSMFGESYEAYRREVGRWLPRRRAHRQR